MSAYTLWNTSLRRAKLKLFVSPLVRYASPYQNSVFEVFEIPITITNSGALPGTVLSMDLSVTNLKTGATKRFYSAGVGSWSLGKGKGDEVRAFMPLSLAGRDNHSDPVLFYARSDERVMQVVDGVGRYKFEVSPVIAGKSKVAAATFEMDLPFMDHRAFTSGSGTLTLNHPDWRATAL